MWSIYALCLSGLLALCVLSEYRSKRKALHFLMGVSYHYLWADLQATRIIQMLVFKWSFDRFIKIYNLFYFQLHLSTRIAQLQ
jgi:hypothetical protein